MTSSRPPRALLVKAARLSAIPGVTMAEACARYEVPRSAVARVKKELGGARPSLDDLLLAALTRNGELEAGELPGDYAHLASWLDYVNHDGCTADEARARVVKLADDGLLEIRGATWRLRASWPRESERTKASCQIELSRSLENDLKAMPALCLLRSSISIILAPKHGSTYSTISPRSSSS